MKRQTCSPSFSLVHSNSESWQRMTEHISKKYKSAVGFKNLRQLKVYRDNQCPCKLFFDAIL